MNLITNKKFFTIIKIAVSVILIGILVKRVEIGEIYTVLTKSRLNYLFFAFLLALISLMLQALRLKALILAQGVEVSFTKILKFNFMSSFFGIFLPTVVGGDLFKAYFLSTYSGKGAVSAATVLADRVIGVYTLILIGILSLLLGSSLLDPRMKYFIAVIFLLGLIFLLVLQSKKLTYFLDKTLASIHKRRLKKIKIFIVTLQSFKGYKKTIYQAVLISALFYFVLIFESYVVALALNLQINLLVFFVFVPLLSISGMIPISISGLGVRETVSVLFFTTLSIQPEYAVLLSLIPFLFKALSSLVGGGLYLHQIIFEQKA